MKQLPKAGYRAAQTTLGAPRSYNESDHTVEAVISVGSPVQRFYGTEVLKIGGKNAPNLSRLASGIPLLDSHQQTGIDNNLGRLLAVYVEGGKLIGKIKFNDTPRGRQAEGMVKRGEITGISAGYAVDEWQITDSQGRIVDPEMERLRPDDEAYTFTAIRWSLFEASLVSVPADPAATTRSADPIGDDLAPITANNNITSYRKLDDDELRLIERIDSARRNTLENSNMSIRILRDERDGLADAMSLALCNSILQSRSNATEYKPTRLEDQLWVKRNAERANEFRGCSLVELAARCIDWRGSRFLNSTVSSEILTRAFQSTSDFPSIFQNALNKALLARYQLHAPTYREIAAERSFVDFRPHPQVRAGDFPQLQPVTETGELKYGTTTDNNEPISVQPYGVVFTISRQMLVNDDLGAIDQILGSAGDMVLVFENVTFYNMFMSNPVLNQDSNAVFSTAHNNLAGSGAAPSVATIAAGRQALREMKSISGNLINIPPAIILTGPAQETAADQMITAITPTLTTSVNPFSGRLRSVSDANIGDNSWFLMTDPARVPNFIYGFLAGSAGPRTRIFEPFGVQGVKVSLEHDFGCGAIDFRGGYKSPTF